MGRIAARYLSQREAVIDALPPRRRSRYSATISENHEYSTHRRVDRLIDQPCQCFVSRADSLTTFRGNLDGRDRRYTERCRAGRLSRHHQIVPTYGHRSALNCAGWSSLMGCFGQQAQHLRLLVPGVPAELRAVRCLDAIVSDPPSRPNRLASVRAVTEVE